MEYEAKRIIIGTWSGTAYLIDGVWYVRPQLIAEAMGLDWRICRQTVVRRWPETIRFAHKVGRRDLRKVLVLPVDEAVQWLCAFAGNNHMDDQRREAVLKMAAAIGIQHAAWALADAPRIPIVDLEPIPEPERVGVVGRLLAKLGGRHD